MARGKNLDRLRELDLEVLYEVVREGEARVAAQLMAATASDQRALTWTGFVVTVTVAVAGSAATIALNGKHLFLAVIGALFSILLCFAAGLSIRAVKPKQFALPGNLPENWLPEEWEKNCPLDLKQARLEQARCLNNQIDDNAKWASQAAKSLSDSMTLVAVSTLVAAVFTAFGVFYVVIFAKS